MNRDNNCCMITGWKDYKYGGSTVVQASHIIPEATNKNICEEGRNARDVRVSLSSINDAATGIPIQRGLDNSIDVH